jgi:predicted acylesterase/phospholipase RssA
MSRFVTTLVWGLVALVFGILYATLRHSMGAETFLELVREMRGRFAALGGIRGTLSLWRARLSPAWRTIIGADVHFEPYSDAARTSQILVSRISVASLGLLACLNFGTSAWFWLPGFCSFVILGYLFHSKIIKSTSRGYEGIKYWILATWAGALLSSLLALSIAIAMVERLSSLTAVVWGALILLPWLAGLNISGTALALKHQTTPWVQLSMGLIGIPFCIAWLFASVSATYLKPFFQAAADPSTLEATRLKTLSQRAAWSRHAGWRTEGGRPITVAVALSGGGYRAATIHAGLLQVLDEKCVPIRYLTTVSGGSIIGGYYALGHAPQAFKEKLIHQRPGLPDEFLAIWNEFANWWGVRTSADTYSRHFAAVFFGERVLGDTGLTPQLIVNVADVEQTDRSREVFFRGRSDHFPQLDKTRLADVVAASGAFPGPFQPKTILWSPEDGDQAPQLRRFIDGGVVENIGYTGLARFLNLGKQMGRSKEEIPNPDYLIMSDASAEGSTGALPRKVDLWQLLSRSQDISFAFQEHLIRAIFSSSGAAQESEGLAANSLLVRAQDKDIQQKLQSEWFPSPEAAGKIRGDEIASEVSQYPTLNELNQEQVEKAFWLGHAMGDLRWQEIDQWRRSLTTEPSCPR